jgi:hypothetical protein
MFFNNYFLKFYNFGILNKPYRKIKLIILLKITNDNEF